MSDLPLTLALRSVLGAAVDGGDRIGLLAASLATASTHPTDGEPAPLATVLRLPRPRTPDDDLPPAA